MVSASLLAQQPTNPPPSAPVVPPATNVAAGTNAGTKPEKKKTSKKKAEKRAAAKKKDMAAELKSLPLVAGPAVVIASNVNVRGQAKLKSEVVTRLNKGQQVTVLEEVTLKNSGPSEPSAWAKIVLPTNAHPWVSAMYIDATNQTVVPKKLQIRAGPGEEYSVLGTLKRGDKVTQVNTKGNWIAIEAPAEAYAFVAAQYLKPEAPGASTNLAEAAAPPTPTEPPPTPAPVTEAAPVATAPTEAPAPATTPATAAPTNVPTATAPAPTVVEEPPPPRIVQREGVVRGTFSIQAPTRFELVSPDSGRAINYLYTTSPDLDLRRYKGLRIIVTGEEGLDERWRNTPVITIQRIQVLE